MSLPNHGRPLIPLVLLGGLVCLFYTPQLLTGTTQWDGIDVHYSAQRYFSDALHAGRLPFWTPYVFSGFPFLADIQVGAWYPLNWPFFLAGISPSSISLELLVHSLIACWGAYALARRLIGRASAALASGLLYGLSGYFAAHSQHVGIFQAAAWLPWLVLWMDGVAERLSLARLAVGGLLGAMLALPGHFQTALYAVCGTGVWALLEATSQRSPARLRRSSIGLLAVGVWGALLAAVMILPGLELVAHSVRPRLTAADIQSDVGYFHLGSLLTLVQPNYYGALFGTYVGPGDKTQHYFYTGILLAPLASIGLRQARVRRVAVFLGVPFVWYALGPRGGLFWLIASLPGFHSVELPMHGWFLAALGLAMLGGAGFDTIMARLGRPRLEAVVLGVMFVDVFVFNGLLNRLAFMPRPTADALFFAPARAFEREVAQAEPRVERVYGPPLTAVGYRNHALQSRVETTYGYNPLELADYAAYLEAAEHDPRLVDGLAATHVIEPNGRLESNPTALPLAMLVDAGGEVGLLERGEEHVIVHYRSVAANRLRVAIPFFPGWHASLNGLELPVRTVDQVFVGVGLPPGEGDVRLWYTPRLFAAGASISLLALLATISVGIVPHLPRRR